MAKYYPDARIDIVEIDQDVITAAEKYFFFETTPGMKITVMDGRRFLRISVINTISFSLMPMMISPFRSISQPGIF